jgi:hypothetical protein
LIVTPFGSVPDTEYDTVGTPVAMTWKAPGVISKNAVLAALVIAGAAGVPTVSVKLCVALGDTPLEAVIVSGYVPLVPLAGVPPSTPVVLLSITPLGRVPFSENVGAGNPLAVTVNDDTNPDPNKILAALVIAGAWFTASVKLCVALGRLPLDAVKVMA